MDREKTLAWGGLIIFGIAFWVVICIFISPWVLVGFFAILVLIGIGYSIWDWLWYREMMDDE